MSSDGADVNSIILEKINKADCKDSVKKFLKRILINELNRKKGEEFVKMYLLQIQKYSHAEDD